MVATGSGTYENTLCSGMWPGFGGHSRVLCAEVGAAGAWLGCAHTDTPGLCTGGSSRAAVWL